MARARMARAEIWLLYNMCVCVFGGEDGVCILEAGCVKFRTRIYFLSLPFCLAFAKIRSSVIMTVLSTNYLNENCWKVVTSGDYVLDYVVSL